MSVRVPIVVEGRKISHRPDLLRRSSSRKLFLEDLPRRTSQGKLRGLAAAQPDVDEDKAVRWSALEGAGGRRGSIGRKITGDPRLTFARKGSGSGLKHLTKRGSRSNMRSYQIKIQVEDEEDKENKPEEEEVVPKKKEEIKSILNDCSRRQVGDKKTIQGRSLLTSNRDRSSGDTSPAKKLDLSKVDRGVVRLRGRGDAGVQVMDRSANKRKIEQTTQEKSARKRSIHEVGGCKSRLADKDDLKDEATTRKTKANNKTEISLTKFAKDALNSHNKYRARHGAVPLVLDDELSARSQEYAEELAKSCKFEHSGDPLYGENLYWAWSSNPTFAVQGSEAVDSWYEECLSNYDYDKEPPDTETGHFTQLVWADSRKLGVGIAKSSTGRQIVVMKYDPPGNYIGRYTKNVLKPVEEK